MRIMAFDVGTKTIGIACTDPTGRFPQPVMTLGRRGVKQDVERLLPVIQEKTVQCLVVGLPYELDDTEARMARLARQVGEALKEATQLPLHYVDERFSSVEAEQHLLALDMSRKKRKNIIDQAAAMVILEDFIRMGL